ERAPDLGKPSGGGFGKPLGRDEGGRPSNSSRSEVQGDAPARSATAGDTRAPETPRLEAGGSLSHEAATEIVEAAVINAKDYGLRVPKAVEVAALRAYLTGQPSSWYNRKRFRHETMPPPGTDPRLDPASPWHGLWKRLEGN